MQKLVEGLIEYEANLTPEGRELLGKTQTPDTLLITCSDSRLVVGLMTGCQPGELFIMRNAGNVVPPYGTTAGGEAATIEYAVSVLKVQHIVVCGHTRCGALNALNGRPPEDLPAVAAWLGLAESTRRMVKREAGDLEGDDLSRRAAELHALKQVDHLKTHPAVAASEVQLHAWVFDLTDGSTRTFDFNRREWKPLTPLLTPAGHRG